MRLLGASLLVVQLKDGTDAPEILVKYIIASYVTQLEDIYGGSRFRGKVASALRVKIMFDTKGKQ